MLQMGNRLVAAGASAPLGATVTAGGVNFSVFSKQRDAHRAAALRRRRTMPSPARSIRARSDEQPHVPLLARRSCRASQPGQIYGYRAHGPFEPRAGTAVRRRARCCSIRTDAPSPCPDGYSRSAASRPGDNAAIAMKSVVADPGGYDWEGDRAAASGPLLETVIYEMHVARLHPASRAPASPSGTARHLRRADREDSLSAGARRHRRRAAAGVPVRRRRTRRRAACNYWGYSAGLLLRAASGVQLAARTRSAALDEFRDMVKALHRAGIEVILDVVFNHTAEGEPARARRCASAASPTTSTTSSSRTSRATPTTPAAATR